MTNFGSDNAAGVSPQIMAALDAANAGSAQAYGADDVTQRLERQFSDLFETDLAVFPVATGTAANALALSTLAPAYGVVFCHENAHIEEDECGAPEFYTSGAKLVTIPGSCGRITPETLDLAAQRFRKGFQHHTQPAAVSLSQATEWGTVYTPEELAAISEVAKKHELALHMDGARFANAVAHLNCSPADLSWRLGVDVLSFGATKNGAMAAEAVLFFKPELAADFRYRRKRGGHLFSKMRFLAAQWDAYLDGDLWLDLARHANAMAARLAEGLSALPGAALSHPVEANEIFARLPAAVIEGLLAEGFAFYRWGPEENNEVRLVTAFNTDPADVDAVRAAARRLSNGG